MWIMLAVAVANLIFGELFASTSLLTFILFLDACQQFHPFVLAMALKKIRHVGDHRSSAFVKYGLAGEGNNDDTCLECSA